MNKKCPKEEFTRQHLSYSSIKITWPELKILVEAGIPVDIESEEATMLTKLRDMVDQGSAVKNFETGQMVQIAIPDLGLLVIDNVTWLEDACTEELQNMLDSGWRILAVCPPNAKRRPDYILGRKGQERKR